MFHPSSAKNLDILMRFAGAVQTKTAIIPGGWNPVGRRAGHARDTS
jgi:hypothetical protein